MDLKVGQTVYLRPRGNAARRSKNIREGVVTEIGRKYFKVDIMPMRRFYIDGGGEKTDFNAEFTAYPNREELEDKILGETITAAIRHNFQYMVKPKYSTEKLKQVADILNLEY